MPLSKQQHLDPNTLPKRILSLDGGGIGGILTLEYLGVIESLLRKRSGRDDFQKSCHAGLRVKTTMTFGGGIIFG